MDDVLVSKATIIKNCLKRIDEEYQNDPAHLSENQTKQDAIILNLQRACVSAIDLGMRMVRIKKLGAPQSSREVFIALAKEKIISEDLSQRMQNMVGFGNIAIHDYQAINLDIVLAILNDHLEDFRKFIKSVLQAES